MTPTLTARLRAVLTAEVRNAADVASIQSLQTSIKAEVSHTEGERAAHAAWQSVILQALAPVVEPTWEPISTAPKDGTPFIGFTSASPEAVEAGNRAPFGRYFCYWHPDWQAWARPDRHDYCHPTHWTVLPLPPATEPRA